MVKYRVQLTTDEEPEEQLEERRPDAKTIQIPVVQVKASNERAPCVPGRLERQLLLPSEPASSSRRAQELLFHPRYVFEQARRRHDGHCGPVDLDPSCRTTTTTRDPGPSTSTSTNATADKIGSQKCRRDREGCSESAIPPPPPTPTTMKPTEALMTTTVKTKTKTPSLKGAKSTTTPAGGPSTESKPTPSPSLSSRHSSPAAGKKPKVLSIPGELLRPTFREVSNAAIAAADPRLDGVAPQYVRDQLEDFGSSLLFGMRGVKIVPPKDNFLLQHLEVVYPNVATVPPTHLIAVFKSLKQRPTHLPVTVFPVHSIFLAAHCARLPSLPATTASSASVQHGNDEQSSPESENESDSSSGSAATITAASGRRSRSSKKRNTEVITLPVQAMALPSPETFSMLIGYLYHKRTDIILAKLLPLPPPPKLEFDQLKEIPRFGREIGRICGWEKVLGCLWRVRGLWMNVCALGIFDEFLWDTMDLVWEVLVVAWGVEEDEIEDSGKKGEEGTEAGDEEEEEGDVGLSEMPSSSSESYEADRSG